MRRAVYHFIARAGIPRLVRGLRSGGATILTYHGFKDREQFDGVIDHQRMRLHVAAFRRQLEHLAAHYQVISLSSLLEMYERGGDVPKNAVVVTFDDGYRSCYTLAYPLLVEFGIPASFFLATDFVFGGCPLWHDRVEYAIHATPKSSLVIGVAGETTRLSLATKLEKLTALRGLYRALKKVEQRERDGVIDDIEREAAVRLDFESAPEVYAPVRIDELAEVARQGLVEIGCHTKSHAILSRCDDVELETETVEAKRVIEGALGRPCSLFCYPNGAAGDFDGRTRAALVRAGFSCALTTVPGRNDASSDRMELRRIGAPRDLAEFEVAASGLRTELARVFHAVRSLRGNP